MLLGDKGSGSVFCEAVGCAMARLARPSGRVRIEREATLGQGSSLWLERLAPLLQPSCAQQTPVRHSEPWQNNTRLRLAARDAAGEAQVRLEELHRLAAREDLGHDKAQTKSSTAASPQVCIVSFLPPCSSQAT